MDAVVLVASILGVLALGVVSPGPSFVLVARTAVATSRAAGVSAAVGMGVGGVVFGAPALLGLHAGLAALPALYDGLKLAGAAYLVWLAAMMWRGAGGGARPEESAGDNETPRTGDLTAAFATGFLTQIGNPKTAVVYGSVFAAFLPTPVPGWLLLVLPAAIFLLEAGWYALVALLFSAAGPRRAYLGWRTAIDRTAGTAMGALGAGLIVDVVRSRL
ncbi:MAG: LysE family transporter [Rhodospirillales bacterium]